MSDRILYWSLKFFSLVFFGFLFSSCASSDYLKTNVVENDEIPFFDPHFATANLLDIEYGDEAFESSQKSLLLKSDNQKIILSSWTPKKNSEKTPLFLVLPGFGGDESSPVSQSVAYHLWKQGFQVLMLPSVTHPEGRKFFLGKQMPGQIAADNKKWITKVSEILGTLNLNHKKVNLIGLSWGALQVMELQNAPDLDQSGIKWGSFVAINPPLNLPFALSQIDQALAQYRNEFTKNSHLDPALVTKIHATNSNALNFAEKINIFEKHEVEFLLAWSFHESLLRIVGIRDSNLDITFADYLTSPWGLHLDKSDLETWTVKHRLLNRQNPWPNNLIVFHSLDDYLNSPDEVSDLKSKLASKMLLYRHGGHLGFMNGSRFWTDLERSLAPLLNE